MSANDGGLTIRDPEAIRARIEAISIPEPNTGCWLLITAPSDAAGYGRILCEGVRVGVHRASKACSTGGIEARKKVLHTCDTPACVNPDHLFVGTSADNYADMVSKGRARHFGPNKRPRMTEQLALAILADVRSPSIVAKELGVAYRAVYNVRCGHTFGHVTGIRRPAPPDLH